MASVPFDTLKAYKSLQEAGFDEAQAEAVIITVGEAFAGNLATKDDIAEVTRVMATKEDIRDMATKADIRDMATKADIHDMATKADIRDMATKADIRDMATKADLHALEVRLMVRLGGLIIAVAGVTVAAIRLLS